ncbi:MAG: NUDIX hydrolase [Chloroflexi bacterium]|nr:NUDIX hydrolase [Chloroflexota bacterium]
MGRLEKPVGRRLGWERVHTRYLYQSPWHHLRQDRVRLPNGEEITYTYQEHAGFVIIVPVTSQGDVVLIRTYRYTVDDWVWELPAGGLGNRPGQSLLRVAQEELAEEVGGESPRWSYHGWFYVANGTTDIRGHLFLAEDVRLSRRPHRENTEVMEVHLVPAEKALAMARSGEIRDGESALSLLRLEESLRRSHHADRPSRGHPRP